MVYQLMDGEVSLEELVLELRGGNVKEAAFHIGFFIVLVYMASTVPQGVEGFKPIRPPHPEWLHFRPPYQNEYNKVGGRITVRSDAAKQTQDAYGEARSHKIRKDYSSKLPTLYVEGQNKRITPWETAKKVYHGPAFGLNPSKYGLTQGDLNSIAKNGIINHIRDGGTVPPADYVKALQKRWKAFAEHKNVRDCRIQTVMGEQCHIVKHDRTRIFLSFKADSGESFTGYQLKKQQSLDHNKDGIIGNDYKKL